MGRVAVVPAVDVQLDSVGRVAVIPRPVDSQLDCPPGLARKTVCRCTSWVDAMVYWYELIQGAPTRSHDVVEGPVAH